MVLLSFTEAEKAQNRIYYTALEPFPLDEATVNMLNYCDQLNQRPTAPLSQKNA